MTGSITLNHRGITARSIYDNGDWSTVYYFLGEPVKTVQWADGFSSEQVKKVIDAEILPFL
jgi:hypothetical protein